MTIQPVAKRNTRDINRQIRHCLNNENAELSVGKIYKGFELLCLNKGQYSIINVLETLLKQTGRADVIISTWTAASAELTLAEKFLESEMINKLHFIVDRSFKTRQPKYFNLLKKKFGEIVSETNSHAKFILIKNNDWNIVVRTSMNFNENKRLETFEVSDDPMLYEYMAMIAADIMGVEFSYFNFELLGVDEKYSNFTPQKPTFSNALLEPSGISLL